MIHERTRSALEAKLDLQLDEAVDKVLSRYMFGFHRVFLACFSSLACPWQVAIASGGAFADRRKASFCSSTVAIKKHITLICAS